MKEKYDVFVRAYTKAKEEKKKTKERKEARPKSKSRTAQKWPTYALIFDTETRITADQSLTFGVFRFCELKDEKYGVVREGLFYFDDLPARERRVLEEYAQTAISDVKSFPPEFPLYSRTDFLRKIFWPAIKRHGGLICGLKPSVRPRSSCCCVEPR